MKYVLKLYADSDEHPRYYAFDPEYRPNLNLWVIFFGWIAAIAGIVAFIKWG